MVKAAASQTEPISPIGPGFDHKLASDVQFALENEYQPIKMLLKSGP